MTTPSGTISPKLLNSSSISASDKVGSKFLTYTDLISSESDSHTHPPQNKKRISLNAPEIKEVTFKFQNINKNTCAGLLFLFFLRGGGDQSHNQFTQIVIDVESGMIYWKYQSLCQSDKM